ncbi:MAG TPA: NAD-dependent epimerase/dehydratase family protein [Streptosporangiales bacterium]
MRLLVVGGTRFIGRRIVEVAAARGDEVMVVHRGRTDPPDLPECRHLHAARDEFAGVAAEVESFAPDAVVDTMALTAADAEAVLPHLPDVPLVVLSSVDVYQAYDLFRHGGGELPVPLDECSPVRGERYPYRGTDLGSAVDTETYEKLDVEPAYLARGGVVLRLGFVYGEHDGQRREEFVLRRVRAGRTRMPVGAGTFLGSRCYVGDVASAVLAALGTPAASGEVFNVVEAHTPTVLGWARDILAAAEHDLELVRVADDELPDDLELTRAWPQHLLFSSAKAQRVLGWAPSDPAETVPRSVRWHLEHPPESDGDFARDDQAMGSVVTGRFTA